MIILYVFNGFGLRKLPSAIINRLFTNDRRTVYGALQGWCKKFVRYARALAGRRLALDYEHPVEPREVFPDVDFRVGKGIHSEPGCGRGMLIADLQDKAATIGEVF